MAIKPFAIQGADLTLGGVNLQAGTTGVVIPGVTQATNYQAEEVNDTGDQILSFVDFPVFVIDYVTYLDYQGTGSSSRRATYTVDTLDDEGYIDGITVESGGEYTSGESTQNSGNGLFAYTGADSVNRFNPFVDQDWTEIPFSPKMRAGAIETIGGGGGTSVTYREVNYPYGEEGDTEGTIAVDRFGNAYICIADYDNSSSQTFTVQESGSFDIAQTGSTMILTITDSTSDEEDVIALWENRETAIPSGWTISGESLGGSYEATYIGLWDGGGQDGLRYITWEHRTGDPTTISNGTEFTLTYNPGSRHIWVPISTGNVVVNGNSLEVGGVGYLNLKTNNNEVVIGSNGNYPVKVSLNEEEKEWTFGTDGSITFPDGTIQSTAYVGGQTETKLWIAAGASPGGAALLHSSNGLEWTTEDYMMDGTNIKRVAISTDKIVYLMSQNGPSDGIYYTSAPEDVPTLATGTDSYGEGAIVSWREINYLGNTFVAVGSYHTTGATVSTNINSIALADGDRLCPRITISNQQYNYNDVVITISGATNTELNGTFRLQYNTIDTIATGVYDMLTESYQIPTITSTDITGATIADLTNINGDRPLFAYSTDGILWTYGNLDPTYADDFGSAPRLEMSDVAYDGTGYLIPVIDFMFFDEGTNDQPTFNGPGAFYITNLTAFISVPDFIPGGGDPQYSLPGTFNNIASYADGTFFISDDNYTLWTGTPIDGWVDHDIRTSLQTEYGWTPEVGNSPNNDVDSAVAGSVGLNDRWVGTTNAGMVISTMDQGSTFQLSIPDPITGTATLHDVGPVLIDFTGGTIPFQWEKITITVANGDDTSWNGTYYVNTGPSAEIFELYDGFEGSVIDGQTWTAPSNPFNITFSRGVDLDSIAIGDNSCVVYSNQSSKFYFSTDLITWTAISFNNAYAVEDIYFSSLITSTNSSNQLVNGNYSVTLNANGTTSIPSTLYPIHDQSIDIGTRDNEFDAIHVHNIKSKTHVNISTGVGYSSWINIYGDLNIDASTVTGVCVDYDSAGNLYVFGNYNNHDNANDSLALKYSPDGDLIWRKTWMNGDESCGSANQKFFIMDDVIYWVSASIFGFTGSIYIGTMNTDGVITAAATKITGTNLDINDMAVDTSGKVYIVGADNNYPMAAKINPSTNTVEWYTKLQDYDGGYFSSVALDGSNNLFIVGTMNDGDEYATLHMINNDGSYESTVYLSDSDTGTGEAIFLYADVLFVYYRKNSGPVVLTSISVNDITESNWTLSLSNNDSAYYPKDVIVDANGNVYAVGIYNDDFHITRLTTQGAVVWQRQIGTNEEEGSGLYGYNSVRMAASYFNRIAIAGYTLKNPLTNDTLNEAKSMTVQIPIDGDVIGEYGAYSLYSNNIAHEFIGSSISILGYSDINYTIPSYSDNNAFVPSTVIVDSDNYVVKIEIRGPTDDFNGDGASWQFDSEGSITMPGGSRISTNKYDGDISIYGGDKSEIDHGYGSVSLYDGSGHSQLTIDQDKSQLYFTKYNYSALRAQNYSVQLAHNSHEWNFIGDSGSYVGAVREPYGHYSIVRAVIRVNTNATDKIVWIARDGLVTSGKFTVNVDTGANDSNFDSMTCEIVLAAKRVSNLNSVAKVSVYGLVYTSADPLMTFDATIIPGGTYTVTDGDFGVGTSGSGSGATITIIANANGSYYSISSIDNVGVGYKVNDTITISGSNLGGITDFADSNYAKIKITSVDPDGGIDGYEFADDTGYTNAGKVAITCTPAAGSANYLYVKIRGTESSSAIYDYYC